MTWLFDSFGDVTWSGEGAAYKPASGNGSVNTIANSIPTTSSNSGGSGGGYNGGSSGGGNVSSVSAGTSPGISSNAVALAQIQAQLKAGRRQMASIASLENKPNDDERDSANKSALLPSLADKNCFVDAVFEAGTDMTWLQLEETVGMQGHVV